MSHPSIAPLPRPQPPGAPSPPATAQVLDLYFLENRAKLLDVAAFLDRLDRARSHDGTDFREAAFRSALEILVDGRSERARRILERLSDPTTAIPDSALGAKGASGAYRAPAPGGAT
ncbi:MAG: hypothetical protein AB7O52_12535 [Planctomycetota bacterium]